MRLAVFLFIFVVGNGYVYSQLSFRGTVTDGKSGKMVEDASVSALNNNQAIVNYTYTNKEGAFVLQTKETIGFISINYMGYEGVIIPVENFKDNGIYRLEPKEFKIKEVKILSNRIRERKDTLIYTVSGFRMPQDRSIADILAKMPGLEVLPSGRIKFENKAISKLYIEGMDLMGDRYALATNNLSGRVVKEVQVLRNHQAVTALRGKLFSENVALNLVLEDAVRYTLSGSSDLGLGYLSDNEVLWDARILGLFLGKKQQNLSLYKTNNTGKDVSDELRMQVQDIDMEVKSNNAVLSLPAISVGQMIDEQRYLINKSHLLATNHLYKIDTETTFRGQFSYLFKDNEMREEENASYFYPDGTVTIAEDKNISLKTDCYAVEADYQSNGEKRFIRNRLVGNIEKNNANNLLLTNSSPVQAVDRMKKKELANYFTLIKTDASNHVFKLLSINSLSDLPQKLIVSPGLYEDIVNNGNVYDAFVQHARLHSFRSHTAAEFQFKVAGFYAGMKTGVEYSSQTLTSSLYCAENDKIYQTENAGFYNNLTFIDTKIYANPSFRYKDQNWNLRAGIMLSYHQYQLNYKEAGKQRNSYPCFFAEPSFLLSYELNPLWNISNSLNYRYSVPDINKFYANYIFTTYRNAFSGSGFYYYRSLIYAATLKFNNPLNGWFWSLSGTLAPNWQDKMLSYNQRGVLNYGEMVDVKNRNMQWGVQTRLSKSFGQWKLFTGFTGSYNEVRDKNLLSDVLVPYTSKNILLSLNFSMQPCKYISMEGSGKYLYLTLSNSITKGISSKYFRSNLAINVFPTTNWKLKWNNLWTTGNRPVYSSIYFMDAAVSYLFKRVEVELIMNNMLDKRNLQQTIYSSISESLTLNYFRPREILIRLMVNF